MKGKLSATLKGPASEALKEELFQLEVDRKQGNISQPEYERARAALDHTLERAIKRGATPPKNAPARD